MIDKIFKENILKIHKSPYGYFDIKEGELILTSKNTLQYNKIILRDVKYLIINGILYIKGTKLFYEDISNGRSPIDWFSKPFLFDLSNEDLSLFDEDLKLTTYTIKKLFSKNKLQLAYNANKNGYFIKLKKETKFLYCLHPFKIQEIL